MSRFDLAIFDLDGTLVDTLSDITEALNFTMRAMDMPHLSESQIAESVGEGIDGILARVLGEEGAREAAALFRSSYLENLCDRTRPYPGIPEMLDATSMTKVVATNKPGGMARRILAELGLGGHFAHVLGDDDVARKKPDPLMVETLRIRCEAAAAQTLLIGDSTVDAKAARAAGVAFCAVSWGYTPRKALLAERPAYLVDTMAELTTLLSAG